MQAWDLSPHSSHTHMHSVATLLGSEPLRVLGNSTYTGGHHSSTLPVVLP